MILKDIEAIFIRIRKCARCGSEEGFWLGVKGDRPYAQCKDCGARVDLLATALTVENSQKRRLFTFPRR